MAFVVIVKQFLNPWMLLPFMSLPGNSNFSEDEFEFGIRKRESDNLRKLYM